MSNIIEGMESFFGRGAFESKIFADETCCFIGAFGNVGVVKTDEGLILFDIALRIFGPRVFQEVRKFSDKPIKYIVYSHGHFDHCLGYAPFIKEIKEKGWEMPQVIAHENCIKRFEKYNMLSEHQLWTYHQQFASVGVTMTDKESIVGALEPTIIIKGNGSYNFSLSGYNFEIHHDKGETDDSIWMYFKEKKVLFTGDLMVSSFPNIGSPFRVQRYGKDWAIAMDKMMKKNAEYLLPGHGFLFKEKNNVQDVLSITAEALNFVHDEVVKRLNQGKWFEQIYYEMLDIYPDKFKNHEFLQPKYGDYRFAITDVYRLYHGWYDSGNPTDLFPAKSSEVAKVLLEIGNVEKYIAKVKMLYEEGKYQLALHVIDVVIKGSTTASNSLLDAYKLKVKLLKRKVEEEEGSFIAVNILKTSMNQLKTNIKELKQELK